MEEEQKNASSAKYVFFSDLVMVSYIMIVGANEKR